MNRLADQLQSAAKSMQTQLSEHPEIANAAPYTYFPLDYAWDMHVDYLNRYAQHTANVLFLGMNPGPFGMAQTGIPFGEVNNVQNWLKIHAPINTPAREHPKRPIQGLACPRSEVSGRRLWGLFRERYGSPNAFFNQHFVANYCPLLFLNENGRNITPDQLPAALKKEIERICDEHLIALIRAFLPQQLVAVGQYAERAYLRILPHLKHAPTINRILHPSPASPAANAGWAPKATQQLVAAGIWREG